MREWCFLLFVPTTLARGRALCKPHAHSTTDIDTDTPASCRAAATASSCIHRGERLLRTCICVASRKSRERGIDGVYRTSVARKRARIRAEAAEDVESSAAGALQFLVCVRTHGSHDRSDEARAARLCRGVCSPHQRNERTAAGGLHERVRAVCPQRAKHGCETVCTTSSRRVFCSLNQRRQRTACPLLHGRTSMV